MISDLGTTTTLLCTCFLIPLILLLWLVINLQDRKKQGFANLPPGPPKLPLIGNLHQLGSLPHQSLTELSKRYGPVMYLRFGSIPVVVISSADMAREVFKTQDRAFSSRPVMYAARKFTYNCSDISFGEYGDSWKTLRKMVVHELLSSKKVQSLKSLREEEVNFMIDIIRGRSGQGAIKFDEVTMLLANNFVCRAAFGMRSSCDGNNDGRSKFHETILEVQILLGAFCVGDLFPSMGWFNKLNGFQAKVEKRFTELDELYNNIIKEHSHPTTTRLNKHTHEEEDLVDVLLRLQKDPIQEITLSHDQIKGVITDMFNAGTGTAASTLVWIMAELIKNPATMKKAQDEVRQAVNGKHIVEEDDHLSKLTYLKAVIKEGLRLHPPLPLLVPRETIEDTVLMGYRIPTKTTVFVNALAIGTDPTIWESPNEFRPERFMDSPIDFKGLDFEFLPFGSGRRGCPGISFGVLLIELALANLLFCFDWDLPSGMNTQDVDMQEVNGLTIHKKLPLCLVATPRVNI